MSQHRAILILPLRSWCFTRVSCLELMYHHQSVQSQCGTWSVSFSFGYLCIGLLLSYTELARSAWTRFPNIQPQVPIQRADARACGRRSVSQRDFSDQRRTANGTILSARHAISEWLDSSSKVSRHPQSIPLLNLP